MRKMLIGLFVLINAGATPSYAASYCLKSGNFERCVNDKFTSVENRLQIRLAYCTPTGNFERCVNDNFTTIENELQTKIPYCSDSGNFERCVNDNFNRI